ncbi:MAG: hypothetical protein F6K42_14170 [Leptolyngbya sp. SIO1D8]|nr:hypothetical protein [Leptolyngbya sp. SIO1D8]
MGDFQTLGRYGAIAATALLSILFTGSWPLGSAIPAAEEAAIVEPSGVPLIPLAAWPLEVLPQDDQLWGTEAGARTQLMTAIDYRV